MNEIYFQILSVIAIANLIAANYFLLVCLRQYSGKSFSEFISTSKPSLNVLKNEYSNGRLNPSITKKYYLYKVTIRIGVISLVLTIILMSLQSLF
jgi:hypothetical protein